MSSNKNIAKNSLFLYLKMFLNMGVALFTAGIVLNTLGIADYGLYSVVGGFVSMFNFLNSSMSSATQRFLSFDLGRGDLVQLKKTFSITTTIHGGIALLILILLETLGLWYINFKLNFPADRTTAVNIIFQLSVLTSIIAIIQVPYNALITAHERFNFYAYISFLEMGLKLLVLFLLSYLQSDKLILYSILLFISSLIIRIVSRIYCRNNFPESHYFFYFDKSYFKTLFAFTGWNLFGYISVMAKNQGVNLLLNAFYGTVVNAAYGITMQMQGIVINFVASFQNAVNPQIVKNYAAGEIDKSVKLMQQSAKFSFGLMIIIVLPVLISLENILSIWLKNYPTETIFFVRLAFINVLVETISHPIVFIIDATGKIKKYQIFTGLLFFMNLPFSYIFLKIFNAPQVTFIVSILFTFFVLVARIYFLRLAVAFFNLKIFIKEVIAPVFILAVIAFLLYKLNDDFNLECNRYFEVFVKSALAVISIILCSYIFLLSKAEKITIHNLIRQKIKQFRS